MNALETAVLLALLGAPVAADAIFLDGFESADTRYWTDEAPPCVDDLGQPAPLCHWSYPYDDWLTACESGLRCSRLCFYNGTPDVCLMLMVEPPEAPAPTS